MSSSKGSPRKSRNSLQEFHLFPELPNELQVAIWELAMGPQIIRFELKRPTEGRRRYLDMCLWDLEKTSLDSALFNACTTSRKVALRETGEKQIVSECLFEGLLFFKPANGTQGAVPRECASIHFNASRDFLYFSDLPEFHRFFSIYDITPGSAPPFFRYEARLASIQRLILGGVLPRITYRAPSRGNFFVQIEEHPAAHSDLLFPLGFLFNLKELIIVYPSPRELAAGYAERLKRGHSIEKDLMQIHIMEHRVPNNGAKDRIANEDLDTTSLQIELFKIKFDSMLKSNIRGRCRMQGWSYENLSSWCKDPKVTWVSEEDFIFKFPETR